MRRLVGQPVSLLGREGQTTGDAGQQAVLDK